MTRHDCRAECRKFGQQRDGIAQFHYCPRRTTLTEPNAHNLDGTYLPVEKAELGLRFLFEGNGVSSVERIAQAHHGTSPKHLVLAGEECTRLVSVHVSRSEGPSTEPQEHGRTDE